MRRSGALVVLLTGVLAFACTIRRPPRTIEVVGSVRDSQTNLPAANVDVTIEQLRWGRWAWNPPLLDKLTTLTTDADGRFTAQLEVSGFQLMFSSLLCPDKVWIGGEQVVKMKDLKKSINQVRVQIDHNPGPCY